MAEKREKQFINIPGFVFEYDPGSVSLFDVFGVSTEDISEIITSSVESVDKSAEMDNYHPGISDIVIRLLFEKKPQLVLFFASMGIISYAKIQGESFAESSSRKELIERTRMLMKIPGFGEFIKKMFSDDEAPEGFKDFLDDLIRDL